MKSLSPFKNLVKANIWFAAFVATLSILAGVPALAQTTVPEKVDVDINAGGDGAGGGGWYAQPWVWVVGAAVLIIIIVLLTRGSGGRSAGTTDKVTYTKQVTREDDL